MTKEECYLLLGFINEPSIYKWAGTIVVEMTIETLTDAIVKSIESRLTDTTARIKEFTPVSILGSSAILLMSSDELLLLSIDDGGDCIDTSEDAQYLFRLLSAEGLLGEVVPEPIVTELMRLRNEVVEARMARSKENDRERDRAEYERLKLIFEAPWP